MADAPAAPDSPPYLSVAQVARRLGCSVSLVQKWRRLGWIHATRLGTPDVPIYGYLPTEVDRFAQESWNRRRGRPRNPVIRGALENRASAEKLPGGPGGVAPGVRERSSQNPARGSGGAQRPPETAASPPRLPRLQSTSLTSTLSSSRPLALWDADPRSSNPIILARFQPTELNYALTLATTWAHRYETLALGEIPSPDTPGSPGTLLALWQNGRRLDPLP